MLINAWGKEYHKIDLSLYCKFSFSTSLGIPILFSWVYLVLFVVTVLVGQTWGFAG